MAFYAVGSPSGVRSPDGRRLAGLDPPLLPLCWCASWRSARLPGSRPNTIHDCYSRPCGEIEEREGAGSLQVAETPSLIQHQVLPLLPRATRQTEVEITHEIGTAFRSAVLRTLSKSLMSTAYSVAHEKRSTARTIAKRRSMSASSRHL